MIKYLFFIASKVQERRLVEIETDRTIPTTTSEKFDPTVYTAYVSQALDLCVGWSPEHTTTTCVPARCTFHNVRMGTGHSLDGGNFRFVCEFCDDVAFTRIDIQRVFHIADSEMRIYVDIRCPLGSKNRQPFARLAIMFNLAEWLWQCRRGVIESGGVEVPQSQSIIVAGANHAPSSRIPVCRAHTFPMHPFTSETSQALF